MLAIYFDIILQNRRDIVSKVEELCFVWLMALDRLKLEITDWLILTSSIISIIVDRHEKECVLLY